MSHFYKSVSIANSLKRSTMSCCTAGHLGSGVGQPDLNQYFPSLGLTVKMLTNTLASFLFREYEIHSFGRSSNLCLLVKATKEVQRIASSDGLLLAAGGEGRLTEDGQGRLVLH